MNRVTSTTKTDTSSALFWKDQVGDLQQEVKSLKQQLDWFKRQIFGQKSEKLVDPGYGTGDLFARNKPDPEPEPATEKITYTRCKKRAEADVTDQGLRFDASVPVKVIKLSAPELEGPDADQYQVIDYRISRRLAQRPGSYVVLEYHRPVVKDIAKNSLFSVHAPSAIFDGAMADVSLIAGLIIDKFVYHLPLNRQHQRMKASGITISRMTLTNYVKRAIALLAPIYDAQWQHILQSRILAMDETPIKAGRKERGKMRQTWYWPIYGEEDEICFSWSSSHSAMHVEKQLKGFSGVLLTDGYAAYDRFAKNKSHITQAQCWVHMRRIFDKAKDSDPAATQALQLIAKIYAVEAEIKNQALGREAILKIRSEKSKPLVEAFFAWCWEQRQRTDIVNNDPLSKALKYATKRQEQLQVFLGDPDLPADTNHLERALRVIPMGRKNWLFNWTEVGAKQVGIIQSLLTTCRLHDINPYQYLVDVLQRIAIHPDSDIQALTPRCWKQQFAENPLISDLELVSG